MEQPKKESVRHLIKEGMFYSPTREAIAYRDVRSKKFEVMRANNFKGRLSPEQRTHVKKSLKR